METNENTLVSQCEAIYTYMNSFRSYKKGNYQDAIRLLSFDDRDNKNSHPSAFSTQAGRDEIVKKCTQMHPVYYFNNIAVIHLKLKKYSLAAYYLSKAVKLLAKEKTQ